MFTDASAPEPPPAAPTPAPPRPPRRRPGLWAGLTAAVVALAVLAVTGFLAPGFLLGEDEPGDPRAVADRLVGGLNSRDAVALDELKCPTAEPDVDRAITGADRVRDLSVDSVREGSAMEAVVSLRGQVDGVPSSMRGRLLNSGGSWCWQDFSLFTSGPRSSAPSSASPSADPAQNSPLAVAQRFVDALNAKDGPAAEAIACGFAGQQLSTAVGKITAGAPALTVGADTGTGAEIGGQLDGGPVSGSVEVQDGCVAALNLA
ncbi:hypothetical protein CFN78_20225 [Amycolatopsis antarctica]|uniref:Uncharacterized protein n=2 Tax=Amycolatopsis antarctica TaxID=1854586 RepID=A0A263CZ76_9PSEU|nr:hypothetical protein CFN78_20225 [Amycolatopsis antarctica]